MVVLAVALTFPLLVVARILVLYDQLPNRWFGSTVRAVIPWRSAIFIAPLLPLYPLTWSLLRRGGFADVGFPLGAACWFLLGVALVEVYSGCLHRESWIPAFEPEWIPIDAKPLGGLPVRVADRRLHQLLRNHVAYTLPLIVSSLMISRTTVGSALLASMFLLKYFAFSNGDFEACDHWNIHCFVLSIQGRPHLTRFWVKVMDYVLGPLNGYVPRVYNANHLLVHHWRNSGPMDIHSPTPFRRSSFLEFCVFALKLTCSVSFASDLAFHQRCRGKSRVSVILNVVGFWIVVAALVQGGSILAPWLVLFALHHGVTMARSQYVWHGLINPADPTRLITSTILWVPGSDFWTSRTWEVPLSATLARDESVGGATTLERVPAPGTDWAFYDNWHLLHHLRPRAHFTEYSDLLSRLAPDIAAAKSVILDMGAMETFAFACWTGDVAGIARHLLTDVPVSAKERFLRDRLEPVMSVRHPVGTLCDSHVAQSLDRLLLKALLLCTGGK